MYLCSSLFRFCDKNKSNEKGRIPSEEADLNFRDAKKFYRTPIVKNIRLLALLFDCLLEMSLIDSNWKSTLHKGCFLLDRNGAKVVSASNLSSSLSAIKRIDCTAKTRIRLAISKLVSIE